jgi:hypothetical protein
MSQTPFTPNSTSPVFDPDVFDLDLGEKIWGTAGTKSGQGRSTALEELTRSLAGLGASLGQVYGDGGSKYPGDYVKEATEVLKEMYGETEKKFDERLSNIYPELTGMTGQEALNKYYNEFANTVKEVRDQGFAQLDTRPDIGSEYDRFENRVGKIQDQYSLANKVGGYTNLALDPAVVKIDEGRLTAAGDRFMDPKYEQMYDYSDPQANRFIYGSQDTANAIGKYYNTSGDVAGLMNYGGLA